jgi:hypothetical protein
MQKHLKAYLHGCEGPLEWHKPLTMQSVEGSSTFSVNPKRNDGFSIMGTYELGKEINGQYVIQSCEPFKQIASLA